MKQAIYSLIEKEVDRAEKLHPTWPQDPIHGAAIIAEEAGEAVRAALDMVYFDKPSADIYKEVVQTAAPCIRFLKHADL